MSSTLSALKWSRVLLSKSSRPAYLDAVKPLLASQLLSSHGRFSSHSPMGSPSPSRKKVTLNTLRSLYKAGEPITMITAHDFPSGHVGDSAGMEMILVGDSLAMVALGMEDTSEVLVDEMLLHCRSVARAAKSAFTVSRPLRLLTDPS
jgi:3-methyl-2-oxobutanoate hydroxymethyltransferase